MTGILLPPCLIQFSAKALNYNFFTVDDKTKDYVNYKLQKAAVSIKEAKLLYENGMTETAVSRRY